MAMWPTPQQQARQRDVMCELIKTAPFVGRAEWDAVPPAMVRDNQEGDLGVQRRSEAECAA